VRLIRVRLCVGWLSGWLHGGRSILGPHPRSGQGGQTGGEATHALGGGWWIGCDKTSQSRVSSTFEWARPGACGQSIFKHICKPSSCACACVPTPFPSLCLSAPTDCAWAQSIRRRSKQKAVLVTNTMSVARVRIIILPPSLPPPFRCWGHARHARVCTQRTRERQQAHDSCGCGGGAGTGTRLLPCTRVLPTCTHFELAVPDLRTSKNLF
jgi:hypothetical protein